MIVETRPRNDYAMRVRITDQKEAWALTDWIDDELCELCWKVACDIASRFGCSMSLEKFTEQMYEQADVGGLRDAIIGSAQDVIDCELVFDYPY